MAVAMFSVSYFLVRPDDGSKPEWKLLACRIILTFVVCDGHAINIIL
jgi:hypothetical protein